MSLETLEAEAQRFEGLTREARIQALIELARALPSFAPTATQTWEVVDVRRDLECQDVVGLYARRDAAGVWLAGEVGAEVTTLTRALTALLLRHLNGEAAPRILALGPSLIERVIGESLLRQRRGTAFYTLRRIQEAVRQLEATSPAHQNAATG